MALESSFGSSYLVLGRLIHETCGDDQLKIEDELASLYWVLPSRHEPRLMVLFMVFQLKFEWKGRFALLCLRHVEAIVSLSSWRIPVCEYECNRPSTPKPLEGIHKHQATEDRREMFAVTGPQMRPASTICVS